MDVIFSFDWQAKVTELQAAKLNEVVSPKIKLTGEPNDKGQLDIDNRYTEFRANLLEIYSIVPDIKIEVKGVANNPLVISLMGKIEALEQRLSNFNPDASFNMKCNVHVPGLGMLAIDEVTWLEDACTERLQEKLEDGWRIIACCPQPDQRRPDYVLGRSKNIG